jgi:hypothetical protein
MRKMMFVTTMFVILSPLYYGKGPFRGPGLIPDQFEELEAVQIVTVETKKLYSRIEALVHERIADLGTEFLG